MTAFFPAGFRATNDDGFPLAGGQLRYYAATTTTPKAVYADAGLTSSLGSIVNINASGEPVTGGNVETMVYPGPGAYKVRLYDANNVLIWEQDNIPGYVAPPEESSSGLPVTPVISKTANYTVVEGDRGKLIKLDPTGGPFEITLPSASAMGDGFRVGFIHTGTANVVTLVADTGQFIRGQAVSAALALVGQGEAMWLTSDGADWIASEYSPPFMKAGVPVFSVKGRSSTPPLSAEPGERWIVQGVLSGAWATLGFQEHDVVEADGDGSWFRYTPRSGWQAYDLEADEQLQYRAGAWIVVPDVVDPGETTLKSFHVQDQKSSGSNGGSATTGSWVTAALNTAIVSTIVGASLNANVITLPAGRYRVTASKTFYQTHQSRIRFKTESNNSIIL